MAGFFETMLNRPEREAAAAERERERPRVASEENAREDRDVIAAARKNFPDEPSMADLKRSEDTYTAAEVGEQPATPVTKKVRKVLQANKPAPPVEPSTTGDEISPPIDVSDGPNAAPSVLADTPPPPVQPRDVELEAAAKESRIRHQVGAVFKLFGANPTDMDQPLEALAARRQLAREHEQDVLNQEQHDPASRASRMVQAVAVKKYGWSPKDAAWLTASEFQMVKDGYGPDQMREARMERARIQKYEADQKRQEHAETLAEESRHNRAMESIDRAKIAAKGAEEEKSISDRVEAGMAAHREGLRSVGQIEQMAGFGDTGIVPGLTPGNVNNSTFRTNLRLLATAEAKLAKGGGATPTREEINAIENGYDIGPHSLPSAIKNFAAEARIRLEDQKNEINRLYGHQGKKEPIPEGAAPIPSTAAKSRSAGSAANVAGYRYNKDRTKRMPVDAKGNQSGPVEVLR